jgi:DNA-binding PadR family transcriptional regulator
MKPRQLELLRRIAEAPRTLHDLTHAANGVADIQLSPQTLSLYLDDLVDLGYITAPVKQHGFYRVTQEGLDYLASLPQITPSTLICGASMKEPYMPSVGYQRNGGHRHILSRGIGA